MESTESITIPEIRELRSDESDEFVTLMELAFKDSIEEDRLDADEVRKVLKKVHTLLYRILQRVFKMRMEFYVAEVEGTIASGIQLNLEKDEVYVGNLMTHPKYQRQGLARKLLHLSFRRARETDVKKVETINHAYLAWIITQPDIGEGILSFLQKREPNWSMRVPDDMPDKPVM